MTARDALLNRLLDLARANEANEANEAAGAGPEQRSGAERGPGTGSGPADGPAPPDDVEAVLDLVFEWFRACFSPERARGRTGVFHYEINTPCGARHRYVSVDAGACTTSARPALRPHATIGVSLHDLVALAVGELKGTDAFVSGRLKISGDVFFAMNWIEWFGARSATPPEPPAPHDDAA